ncbi:MAG: hypothetical protein ACI91T_001018 [Natronomonas sp.]|jgi:hypothetical protein
MTEYQPGVCNIGADEQRKRQFAGAAGFLVAIAYVLAVVLADLPTNYLLVTFVFLFGGFIGYFQARFRFCVAFAALARYDLSGSGGGTGTISEEEALRRDRRQAVKITLYAAGAAAAVTVVVYGIGLVML